MLNTPTDAPADAALVASATSRRRRGAAWALLAVAVAMALVFVLRPEPSRVERGEVPRGWPNPKGSFKNSVVRRMPMWVWRVRDWVRGPRRVVMIEAQFVALENWSAADVERLGLGTPALAEANGVRVWLVSSNLVKAARSALSQGVGATKLSSPRIQTADGMLAMMMTGASGGNGPNNFSAEAVSSFEPRIRGAGLDLKAILSCESPKPAVPVVQQPFSRQERGTTHSSVSNTTTATAAPITHPDPLSVRVQIRDGQGVLVLQEKRAGIGGRPLAIWIQAAPVPGK